MNTKTPADEFLAMAARGHARRTEAEQLRDKLEQIKAICLRYNHPGCNQSTHWLANRVIDIADGEREYK